MRGFLTAMLATLRAWLTPRTRHAQTAAPAAPRHIVIASHTRRYPGRSSQLQLRQNQGWIAETAHHSHQDRRA